MQRPLFVVILAILLATVVIFSPNNAAISVADTGPPNLEESWIRNPANGHYYALTEPMSWTEAEARAQERGGHLVTLRNWEEELWIKDTFGRNEYFWIGFSDIEEEGNWVWSSGEPVVYTNWEEGEPNNCGGWPPPSPCYPEDEAVINWARSESAPGQFGDRWNDVTSQSLNRGVAEIIPDYILIVSSTAGGSVISPGEGEFPYKDGMVVDLIGKIEEGCRFVSWTGDVGSIADIDGASTSITINGNYTITASFEPIPEYTLTISSTAGGSVTTPEVGTSTYDEGTVVDLVAEADEGYQFVEWSGNIDTIADVEAASTTITMNDDYSIVANFEAVGGCFVATAAYGTPLAEEIQTLRDFRDEYVLTSRLGQGLVDVYYSISPPIADFIAEHASLKAIVRAELMPIVVVCGIVLDIVPQFTSSDA